MSDELAVPSYEGMETITPDEVGDANEVLGTPNYEAAEEGGIIDFDVSNIKNPFEPAPHGNYRLEIKEYKIGVSKSSNNPMISAQYEIIAAADEANADHVGKTVFDNMIVQGNGSKFGLWRHKQITEAVGLPAQGGVPAKHYIGRQFDAELGVQPGDEQNPPKNTIKNVFI